MCENGYSMRFIHDDHSQSDLIGHKYARDALVGLIDSAKLDATSSFTIGIFGEWGTGKTTMLRQIEAVFKERDDIITVWFNPWQFSRDNDIIRAFFQILAERLEQVSGDMRKDDLEPKIRRFADSIRKAATALGYRPTLDIEIPYVGKLKLGPGGMKGSREKESTIEQLKTHFDQEYRSIYYDMVQFLEQETANLDNKVVVFVDDLDRCMPDQAIQLLEGLKVLLNYSRFIFVIGVAHEIIERAVQQRYDKALEKMEKSDTNTKVQYLDKIIQFSFVLPRPDVNLVKDNILKPALQELPSYGEYADAVLDVVGANPRSLKRFLNVVAFAYNLASQRISPENPNLVLVLRASLIAFTLPALYIEFEKQPEALAHINKAVLSIDTSTEDDLRSALFTGSKLIDDYITNQVAIILYRILTCGDIEQNFSEISRSEPYLRLSSSARGLVRKGQEVVRQGTAPRSTLGNLVGRLQRIEPGQVRLASEGVEEGVVGVTKRLLADRYPVTQELYQLVMDNNPSEFNGEDLPVENVSWFDAVEFCNGLSREYGLDEVYNIEKGTDVKVDIQYDRAGFRLPTEAEWMHMCGSDPTYENEIDRFAWYMNNSNNSVQSVGTKASNANNMYDMLGNVWEWCNDWYSSQRNAGADDPIGPVDGFDKVCKGGSWSNFANVIKPMYRTRKHPATTSNNIGFRIVTIAELG